jgi:hypothetical protein
VRLECFVCGFQNFGVKEKTLHITDIAEEEILTTVKYIADVLRVPIVANNLLDELKNLKNIMERFKKRFADGREVLLPWLL